jgi:hypothetical protein
MADDPIVEEIHEIRRQLLEEHGGMDGYMVHLQQLQLELRNRIVRREPRKPVLHKQRAS